jgi:hypothetical protein
MKKVILALMYLVLCAQVGRLAGILVQGQPISIIIITGILLAFLVSLVGYKLFKFVFSNESES